MPASHELLILILKWAIEEVLQYVNIQTAIYWLIILLMVKSYAFGTWMVSLII
jgi:hypothetical protein